MKLRQRHEGFFTWLWSAFAFFPVSATAIVIFLLALVVAISMLTFALNVIRFLVLALAFIGLGLLALRWLKSRLDHKDLD